MHENQIQQVAGTIVINDLVDLIKAVESILNSGLDVEKYLEAATEITKKLKNLQIQAPLFHHSIKNIDPEIYGKANDFIKQIEIVVDCLYEIAEEMVRRGHISGFKTSSKNYIEYKIVIPVDSTLFKNMMPEIINNSIHCTIGPRTFYKTEIS